MEIREKVEKKIPQCRHLNLFRPPLSPASFWLRSKHLLLQVQQHQFNRMDGPPVLYSHGEKEEETSPDGNLARRLKNRERQRRYRARKRREAELRKALIVDHSTPPIHYLQMPSEIVSVPVEVEVSIDATSHDRLSRVHCRRDWKKDARSRANLETKHEPTGHISLENTRAEATAGSSVTCSEFLGSADSLFDNSNTTATDINAASRLQPSQRRHWKAEARNQKNFT